MVILTVSELYAALGNETWTGYGVNTGVISYSRGDEMNEFRATFMGGNYTLDVPFGDFTAASKAENTDGSFTYTLELPLPAYTGLSSETVKITIKDGAITGLQSENAGLDMNKEGAEITDWAALQAAVNNGGVIKLTTDVTATPEDAALTVPAGETVVIDLNGHTLNRALTTPAANGSVIINNGTLAIMGDGQIKGGNTTGNGGGILNNGAFTLYGGEITGNKASGMGGGVYNTANVLPGGFWMTGGLIDGNTAGSFAAIGGDVTFNKQAAVQVDADGTVVDINTAAANMMSYSYIRPALPSVDQMMTTPARQASGAWQAYMPAGNRMIRVIYKDEPQLAWLDAAQEPVTAISGYHGFPLSFTVPQLGMTPLFETAVKAKQSHIQFVSSNEMVFKADTSSHFEINGVGEATIAAVHPIDDEFLFDSVAYQVTVLAPDTVTIETNDTEWGTVEMISISDSIHGYPIMHAIPGATYALQAHPADGYHLRYWSNGAALNDLLTMESMVAGNENILAFFAPDTVPAVLVDTPMIATGLAYTGAEQTLISTGTAIGGVVKYSLDSINWAIEQPTAKDAGLYTIYYYVDSTDVLHRCLPVETVQVSIAKSPLTITADSVNLIYGDPIPAYTVQYNGFLASDEPSVLTDSLIFTCDYAPLSNVGVYPLTPSGLTAGNYDITFVPAAVKVAKAPVAFVAPVAKELTYNAANQDLVQAGTTADGTFYYREGLEGEWTTTVPQAYHAGEYDVYYKVLGDGNHLDSIIAAPIHVEIAKAELTATADNKTIIFGEVAPAYSITYTGFQGTDTDAVLEGELKLECDYERGAHVGEYTIVPSGVTNDDYVITFVDGVLTVNRKPATSADITAAQAVDENLIYTALINKPTIIVKDTTLQLIEEADYTLTFKGVAPTVYDERQTAPIAAGTYTAVVTFIDNYEGTLEVSFTIAKAVATVTGAEVHIAKFADGTTDAEVTNIGTLENIQDRDIVRHTAIASFSDAEVGDNKTITINYQLVGNENVIVNYELVPASVVYTTQGVIVEPMIPDNTSAPEDQEAEINEGIEVYGYGYCEGSAYSLKYHLEKGNPDQYKIEFEDPAFTDVDWVDLIEGGKDGMIDITIPEDLPTGDYKMTVTFRDSRFDWLESNPFIVEFHVNLPETYVMPLFDNTIALVDTCNCLSDIQWYHRANSTEAWQAIEGANGYYYHADGKLEGEYFVRVKVYGVETYTCPQTDMETLYKGGQKAQVIVRAYPNPVVNNTTVTIENSEETNHILRVVNISGVEVLRTNFEGNETMVEMSDFVQGNYMISVDGITVKVLKQ
jgi:hypothetical protein